MRRALIPFLQMLWFSGCVTSGTGRLIGDRYFDGIWHFSLNVPTEWGKSTRVGLTKSAEKVRFLSPDGLAQTSVFVVPVGIDDCLDAVKRWLRDSKSAIVQSESSSTQSTKVGSLTTSRGSFASQNDSYHGWYSLFCDGGSAVVAVASGPAELTKTRESEITAVLESFRYLDATPSAAAEPGQDVATIEPFVHEVKSPGQTLEKIAAWYTGSKDNWPKLAAPLNPDLFECCVALRVGRKVSIPRGSLITTDPMTSGAALSHPSKKGSQ